MIELKGVNQTKKKPLEIVVLQRKEIGANDNEIEQTEMHGTDVLQESEQWEIDLTQEGELVTEQGLLEQPFNYPQHYTEIDPANWLAYRSFIHNKQNREKPTLWKRVKQTVREQFTNSEYADSKEWSMEQVRETGKESESLKETVEKEISDFMPLPNTYEDLKETVRGLFNQLDLGDVFNAHDESVQEQVVEIIKRYGYNGPREEMRFGYVQHVLTKDDAEDEIGEDELYFKELTRNYPSFLRAVSKEMKYFEQLVEDKMDIPKENREQLKEELAFLRGLTERKGE